jgi:uncharacterized membrane protein
MRAGSRNQSFVRGIRRSVGWKAFKEYVGGALWVMPSIAALIALAAGYGLSQIEVPPGSRLDWLAFQGTADDARALLISISSTVVTVIALVLGLTVVALQLSSTQFSPRLLRNFLRDRPRLRGYRNGLCPCLAGDRAISRPFIRSCCCLW